MGRIKKRYILLILFVLMAAIAFVWVRSYILDRFVVRINDRIQALNLSGFNIRYEAMRVNWRSSGIEIDNVVVERDAYDTTCVYPEFIAVDRVRAEGIGLLRLIFRNVLSLDAVYLDTVRAVIREHSRLKPDETAQQDNEFALEVARTYLRNADITYTDSAECQTLAGLTGSLSLTKMRLDFHSGEPMSYTAETAVLDHAEVRLPDWFYTFRVRQAAWNTGKQALRIDSIDVIPALGKIEFGKKHGFEIDRFECAVPSFAASGISWSLRDSLEVRIGFAEIAFNLNVFRDKRLPFKYKRKLLPVAQLRRLPFSLKVDSLKVTNSFVQYEEFAEGTSDPGGIYFDELQAVLKNISNIADTGMATLNASARLFGQGSLTLFCVFPYEKSRRASLSGAIRNFNLPGLNPILTPTTQMQVESGTMKALAYQFSFNEMRSDGEIELNYENLKLVTFKSQGDSDEEEPEIDNLKTFMMNTFVFRKNMTESMPEERRTGTVAFVRDDGRSIFNYWSKSLISGIKSAYNIDKAEARKSDRELKKEERLSRREARRQRRAEKKRQRG